MGVGIGVDIGVPELLADAAVDAGRVVREARQWVYVDRPGLVLPEHGWKLHLAARPSTLVETVRRVLPVLLDATCAFKVIPDRVTLAALNSSENTNPGAVGKAITVYVDQSDPAAIVRLAGRLVRELSELRAPVVRSDRRVSPSAPVYYRYGPFRPRFRSDNDGNLELVMYGPDGAEFPGLAGPIYACPPWARDPFVVPGGGENLKAERESRSPASGLVGGRYRLRSGVQRSSRGAVYRADEVSTDTAVIVKQAYAWVGEDSEDMDVRARLRNERRILSVLAGLDGVPAFVDHFRHDEDEFVAITEVDGRTLGEELAENGCYVDPCDSGTTLVPRADGRTLRTLAADLVALLDRVHDRGVVHRDLAPKNILVSADGRPHLVDFEISAHDDVQFWGHTPGYAPPHQIDNPPATVEDDYYALGATLFHAATGLSPVLAADQRRPCVAGTLDCLVGVYPALADGSAQGAVTAIPDLLSGDPHRQRQAMRALRRATGTPLVPVTPIIPVIPSSRTPAGPVTSEPGVDTRLRSAEQRLVRRLHAYAAHSDDDVIPAPVCVHTGATGIALELLDHPDQESRTARERILDQTRRTLNRIDTPAPGLMFGATGIAVALAIHAISHPGRDDGSGGDPAVNDPTRLLALATRLAPPDPDHLPPGDQVRDDHTHGLAGIGTGHLWLASLTGNPRHLDVADRCAARLAVGDCVRTADTADPDRPDTGASVTHGFAHGTAGVLSFLLDRHAVRGSAPDLDDLLDHLCRTLVVHLHRAIDATHTPRIRPMAGSMCQGIPGLGTTLLKAAHTLGRPDYLDLATQAGHAAVSLAPRIVATSQCCGLAGLGDFLLDLAAADTDHRDHWRHQARRTAAILLTRFPDPDREPDLARDPRPAHDPGRHRNICWGAGDAGTLSFLRRLNHDGHRLWPLAAPLPPTSQRTHEPRIAVVSDSARLPA